jgi:hypothetical protein
VTIRRSLAAARRDAFLPDLARSYGAHGRILQDTDPIAAVCSFAEGMAAPNRRSWYEGYNGGVGVSDRRSQYVLVAAE